ncbi:hypothetical protein WN51_14269 [Melipona quadrifasciata]|uniref:Uncharacterized protein n=1 Tax=Melipona quadrifasciata TaxID=166423 RepID=A0A0M9A1C9_9HYME|nr:hypothetical protein WN51_14269 [Melipona quadrifasciata]
MATAFSNVARMHALIRPVPLTELSSNGGKDVLTEKEEKEATERNDFFRVSLGLLVEERVT